MIELEINKKIVQVPETWAELNEATLLALAQVYFGDMQPMDKLSWVLGSQLGLKKKEVKNADAAYVYQQLEANGVFEKMMFLLGEFECTKQLLPILVNADKIELHSIVCEPQPLYNLKMKEWMLADQLFNELMAQWRNGAMAETDTLNSFVGLLYRPKGVGVKFDKLNVAFKGDVREPMNDSLLDNGVYASRVAGIAHSTKMAVVLWYWACRAWLVKEYAAVFEGGGDSGAHPAELIIGVAESGVFGNKDAVEVAYLHDVMIYLQRAIRTANTSTT
jgi:hypothetical protein